MSTLHVKRTYAEATSPPPDVNCTTTTSVPDEQQPTLPALQSFDQAARRRAASSSEVPSASSWQAETACPERVAPSSNASTSLAEPSAWQTGQMGLNVALPPPAHRDEVTDDDGFSVSQHEARRQRRNMWRDNQLTSGNATRGNERTNESGRHLQSASMQSAAAPTHPSRRPNRKNGPKEVRGTKIASSLHAGPITRELFIYRVNCNHNEHDVKTYLEAQHVKVLDIECVSNPESYNVSFRTTVQCNDFDKLMEPDFWPEGVCCRRYYRKR